MTTKKKLFGVLAPSLESVSLDEALPDDAWDTLIALVERGPLESGEVPSKAGLMTLFEKCFSAQIVLDGAKPEKHLVATWTGANYYIEHVLGAGDNHSLEEAIAKRKEDIGQVTESSDPDQ